MIPWQSVGFWYLTPPNVLHVPVSIDTSHSVKHHTSHPQVSDYTVYNLLPFFIDVSVALANKYRLSNLQTFTNERGTEKSKFFSHIEKAP